MAWGKMGSVTATGSTAGQTLSTLSDNKFIQIMSHQIPNASGNVNSLLTFNGDVGTNQYQNRYSDNGGTDGTFQYTSMVIASEDSVKNRFEIIYVLNIAEEEKLIIGFGVNNETYNASTGAGSAPVRTERVSKWINTADVISSIKIAPASNNYVADTNISVLGSDITPAAAIPAPDNVQDNSIFVEKDTSKRYWFDSGVEPTGTSGTGGDWAETSFNNSTIVNNESASGNVVTRTSGSGWNSYIRSNEYISPSTGGGEIYFTQSANTNISVGLEKSPFNPAPSATYTGKDYSFHTTSSSNNMYEHTADYAGTAWASATNEYRITMDSAGLVKYYWRSGSSGAWTLERESTVIASGDYYFTVSHSGTAGAITSYIKGTPATWTCMGSTSSSEVSAASNVFLWLDAQDTCSITKDSSGKVSAWVNKIDDTDTLVQTTASKQPTYEPNGKSSGLPAVHFDGVDDFMELPAFTSGEATQPNQYFVVYKLVSTSSVAVFDKGNNAGGRNIIQDSSNNFNVHAGLSGIDGAITKDVFVLGTYLFNTTASTVRKNGAQQGSAVSCGTNGQNGFTLGSNSGGVDRITDIKVCEVIGISNSSATDRANIESYLNTKWSVY